MRFPGSLYHRSSTILATVDGHRLPPLRVTHGATLGLTEREFASVLADSGLEAGADHLDKAEQDRLATALARVAAERAGIRRDTIHELDIQVI